MQKPVIANSREMADVPVDVVNKQSALQYSIFFDDFGAG